MAHQVKWTEDILQKFETLAPLDEKEIRLMDCRVRKGYSLVEQADELGVSLSTINRMTKTIKLKYDNCVNHFPDIFKKRENENVWR